MNQDGAGAPAVADGNCGGKWNTAGAGWGWTRHWWGFESGGSDWAPAEGDWSSTHTQHASGWNSAHGEWRRPNDSSEGYHNVHNDTWADDGKSVEFDVCDREGDESDGSESQLTRTYQEQSLDGTWGAFARDAKYGHSSSVLCGNWGGDRKNKAHN